MTESSPHGDPRWVLLLLMFPLALGIGVLLPQQKPTKTNSPTHRTPTPKVRTNIKVIQIDPPKRTPTPKIRPGKLPKSAFFKPFPFQFQFAASQAFYLKQFKSASSLPISNLERRFIKAVFAARRAEALKELKPSILKEQARQAVHFRRIRGIVSYRRLGFKLLSQFETALHRYLKLRGPLLSIPNGKQPQARVAVVLTNFAGDYTDLFRRFGVSPQQTQLSPLQILWMRAFFLARWARLLRGELPFATLLHKNIYHDFLRARVVWARTPKARLWAVNELSKQIKTFPSQRVLGWLSIQLDNRTEARKHLLTALKQNPKDPFARQLLDKL